MKSQSFTIEKAFVQGQRTDSFAARNKDVLERSKNMRPTEYGLAAMKIIDEPVVSPPALAWPYPQLFKGKSSTLLAAEQAVYDVNESTWALTLRKIYDLSEVQAPTTSTIVTNGTFTGAATGWTLGSGWSYAGNVLVGTAVTGEAGAVQANASQAGLKMEANALYRVTVDIVSSDLVGSLYMTFGDATSDYFSTVGTHTFDIRSTTAGDIGIRSTDLFTGTVDNVVVKKIAEVAVPTGGGAWHFVDFRGVWFLIKENFMIVSLPYYSDGKLVGIGLSADDFSCNSGENVGNRLFLGGITAATLLASTDWAEAWNAWIENSSEWSDEVTYEDMTLSTSVLMYSTRVGGDISWPFIFEMAMLGFPYRSDATTVAELKANYIDLIRKGEIGFVPLQHQGAIKCLKRLGNSVVAYCEDGVSIVSPRPERGFSAEVIHNAGIASRSAVAGDESRHLFLDTNSVLWGISADGRTERVCGTGTFNTMVANAAAHPIIGSYDPEEQEYYIVSDQDGYIKTRTGIGKLTLLPNGLSISTDGLIAGGVKDLDDGDISVETETFDMGMRALKTIHNLAIGYEDITNLRATIRYKYANSTTWRDSSAFLVNSDSIATPIFTAGDFRIKLTGTPGPNAKIDYINVTFQIADKRNIRTQYE